MKTMGIFFKLLAVLTFLCSNTVYSQWYETQGYAPTNDTSIEIARTKAVENALKKALLVSGANVSSVQQVVNGLLTQDNINVRSSGSVNALEIIDEIHTSDIISVTIRADIIPQDKKCFAVNFKKSLLITRSHLLNREQANIGEIYQIDKTVMQRLSDQLDQHSQYAKSANIIDNKTDFHRLNNSLENNQIQFLTQSLSQSTDSQYVLFSEITNLSFEQKPTNAWVFWQQGIYPRSFAITLYLYNGINGELVWQESYANSAPWTFSKRIKVDVNGSRFWQSEYGTMLDGLITNIAKDIDENIMCEPSQGVVLKVNGNQVTINLGRSHGLKVGDEFTILHLTHFTNNLGKSYTGYNVSPTKVKVNKLTRETAIAVSSDGQLFDNVQVDDLVVRY